LIEVLGRPADKIIADVWDHTDLLIANSKATAACFDSETRQTSIVYNTADFDQLRDLPKPHDQGPLRVGLISSNVPKKGIWDFTEVAKHLGKGRTDVEFLLIGPTQKHTNAIDAKIKSGALPDTLRIAGYRDTPADAIAEIDVVLSLSSFQESFGRTVLEAMAASRPAIVYDHGAPPEMIVHGDTGYVVPYGDTKAVADAIEGLIADRRGALRMGLKARDHAQTTFGRAAYNAAMAQAYAPLLETLAADPVLPEKMVLPARNLPIRTARADMKIAYFCWHFPVPSETFVLNELRELIAQGFDVKVYCKQSPFPDFKPDFDITWDRVTSPDDLAEKLVTTGRSVVHSHFVYPTVTDMVWPACEKANVPFTFIAHAQDIFRYKNDAVNRIDEVAASPMCKRVFVPATFHRDYLNRRSVPMHKMTINPNGMNPDLYVDARRVDRAARTTRKITAVHRFTEKKGLIYLIRAAALLGDLDVEIDLHGYGDLEDTYRAEIAKLDLSNVNLCGPVKGREAMLDIFRNADLFACPSVRAEDGDMDGIPTVVMEAMASGLPVLTSDLSGIPDLVDDGITGMVAPLKDGFDPETLPAQLADRIRAFFALPDTAVDAMVHDALARIEQNYNTVTLVDNLLRVWCGETTDLMIVSWNNLPQTREVIRRLYENTALPFHLVVCDNGSGPEALAHLLAVYGAHENVTLILNRKNAFVGPGTNICMTHGTSDIAIYVCGKEGMTTKHGWEKGFVAHMRENPNTGQAGTFCYSPSYLHGRDYITELAPFPDFRNTVFAQENPDRPFRHIQGGFFAIRRAMFDQIGGFSDVVKHNHTDVEFSYYVESCGWDLGEVDGLMALFNKTRPALLNRVDDSHGALHPPDLDDLPTLDQIANGTVRHCNVCATSQDAYQGGDTGAICGECGSTRRARSIYRVLAESILLYRRLPALGVGMTAGMSDFWTQQFQGKQMTGADFIDLMASKGRTDFADKRLAVVGLCEALAGDGGNTDRAALSEAARLLKDGGTLLIAGDVAAADITPITDGLGLHLRAAKRFTSPVVRFDWTPVLVFEKAKV
jgi:glycosyltransferase involved in cell wall biosynthesis